MHLFEIKIFCDILSVFVTFDAFNNKYIYIYILYISTMLEIEIIIVH